MKRQSHTPWLCAIFVVAAVFYLVPSAMAASAAVLTLSVSPAVVTSGEQVTLEGALSDASTGALIPMQIITVQSSPDGVTWTRVLSTISRTGQFQVTRLMRDPGTYYFRVQYPGSRTYAAATSPPVVVTVKSPSGQKASSLSIYAAPHILAQGGTVTISGTLVASQGGRGIQDRPVIVFSSSDGTSYSPVGTAITDQSGRYSHSTQMNTPGRFFFKAVYNGDSSYTASASAVVAVDVTAVQQKATTLSIVASNSSLSLGQSVNLTGVLKETYGGIRIPDSPVTVQFSFDGGAWSVLGQRTTDRNGEYLAVHTPSKAGKYLYRATYSGSTTHAPSESPSVTVNVTSLPGPGDSNLSIQVSPKSLGKGGTVTISGNLTAVKSGKGIPGRAVILFSSSDGNIYAPLGVATTSADGKYSSSTQMNTPGRFFFKAVYNGDGTYTASASPVVAADVSDLQQKSTALSIRPSSFTFTLGQSVDLAGVLAEAGTGRRIAGSAVGIQYSLDGAAWNSLGQKITDGNGEYLVVHTPSKAGTYQYRATYSGNATYAPSASPYVSVIVRAPSGPGASALSINATPRDISPGGTVTISGNLTAAINGKGIPFRSIIVLSSSDNTSFSPLGVVTTSPDGKYTSSTQLNTPGRFFFKAVYNGDSTYTASASPVVAVNVTGPQQKATTLTIGAAPVSLSLGQSVEVAGVLKETQGGTRVPGAVILVQYSVDAGAWSTLGQRTTDEKGEYTLAHTPSMAGTYKYRATYAGSTTHASSASATVTIRVTGMPLAHGTMLTIQSTPASPLRGEPYTLSGLLRDTSTGKGISGKAVRVERSTDLGTWTLVGMAITQTGGSYSVSEVQQAGGRFSYRAAFSGDRSYLGSASPVIPVVIKRVSEVSLSASPVLIPPGGTVNCTGTLVDPQSGAALAGEPVKVMISPENAHWTVFGTAVTGTDGSWKLASRIANAGSYYLAARFEGSASYDEDWSNSVGITVR
ncbi:MAG: Bacterial Ig-like domain (group 1) [Methanoregulaceae archaeon PtaU1.Bin066]|nr:MAG: Bacterial Ig-like domain (group 1) [Methanoregulaceae archaeon PtaU1.Bin066]